MGRMAGDEVGEVGRGQSMRDLVWTLTCPFSKVCEPLALLEQNDKNMT